MMVDDNMNWSKRAGRYIKQPTGYRAFIPTPLPPVPPIIMEDEMCALLSRRLGLLVD